MPSTSPSQLEKFSAEQCAALYCAVQNHDEIDKFAVVPDRIHLDYNEAELWRCYSICRQLWHNGVDRREITGIIARACRGNMTEDDILSFKHIRAKFKQLRFIYGALSEKQIYPRIFNWTTQTMGGLQDGFRNGDKVATFRNAVALRFLLSAISYRMSRREIDNFRPASARDFQRYVRDEVDRIGLALSRTEITGKSFHELRKSVSRQVALYDTLKTLYPSDYHERVGRYIGTINGMMGAVHDNLVATKLRDPLDYRERGFALPTVIRDRLQNLVRSYRAGA